MDTEEYEGWTNRETWLLNLWINNDETWYNDAWEKAAEIIGSKPDAEQVHHMATWLEEWIEKEVALPASISGFVTDLLGTWRINYREVAFAILEGVSADFKSNSEGD